MRNMKPLLLLGVIGLGGCAMDTEPERSSARHELEKGQDSPEAVVEALYEALAEEGEPSARLELRAKALQELSRLGREVPELRPEVLELRAKIVRDETFGDDARAARSARVAEGIQYEPTEADLAAGEAWQKQWAELRGEIDR